MLERDQGGYVEHARNRRCSWTARAPRTSAGCSRWPTTGSTASGRSLTEGLRTGEPQNEIKTGGDFFGELYGDRSGCGSSCASMTGLSTGASHAIAAKFPWHEYETFIDIGTAEGGLPVTVALAHEHI